MLEVVLFYLASTRFLFFYNCVYNGQYIMEDRIKQTIYTYFSWNQEQKKDTYLAYNFYSYGSFYIPFPIYLQVHFPLESVLEEAEEEDEKENQNTNNVLTSRDEITPTTRVPSQRSRAILIRTPAKELDQSESPLEFPNDEEENNERTDILITEVKDNDYGSDIDSEEEDEELVFEHETNKPQLTEDDYDTDLEIDGENYLLEGTQPLEEMTLSFLAYTCLIFFLILFVVNIRTMSLSIRPLIVKCH